MLVERLTYSNVAGVEAIKYSEPTGMMYERDAVAFRHNNWIISIIYPTDVERDDLNLKETFNFIVDSFELAG